MIDETPLEIIVTFMLYVTLIYIFVTSNVPFLSGSAGLLSVPVFFRLIFVITK